MRSLKKILLWNVKLWVFAVTLAAAVAGMVAFDVFVDDAAALSTRVYPLTGGRLGRVIYRIARMPESLYLRFAPPRPTSLSETCNFWRPGCGPVPSALALEQRFHDRGGLTFADGARDSLAPTHGREAGYLVVARHLPSRRVVELIDLNQRRTVHVWKPDWPTGNPHLYALPDGSLLMGRDVWTFRIDSCSNVVWGDLVDGHHTIERDADGNFWMPWDVAPKTVPHAAPDLRDQGLIRYSPDGEILSRIALSGALIRNGNRHLLYRMNAYDPNPFNINDVEPVLQDGPFWRRGDLFVSLRTNSVVLLYRPTTDEVLWLRAGPWLHQHDVDVVSETEISVFSNNAVSTGGVRPLVPRVLGANEVYVHDFAAGETRSPWREAMRRHEVRTETRGGATLFADGSLMLEESAYGRILMLSPDGERVWSYVNRAPDGLVYRLGASRYLDAEYGKKVMRSISSVDCGRPS